MRSLGMDRSDILGWALALIIVAGLITVAVLVVVDVTA